MRTKKPTLHSFSLDLPRAWEDLHEGEYRFLLTLLSLGYKYERIALTATIRHIPPDTRRVLTKRQIAAASETYDFINEPPVDPRRRLPYIISEDYKAVHPLLADLPFGQYLVMENYYQAYLSSQKPGLLDRAALILYPSVPEAVISTISHGERLNVLFWMIALKARFSKEFPYLFAAAPSRADANPNDQRDRMNAQIRALTGGDVTKEKEVLAIDTYRALTELDAKAREAEILNKK